MTAGRGDDPIADSGRTDSVDPDLAITSPVAPTERVERPSTAVQREELAQTVDALRGRLDFPDRARSKAAEWGGQVRLEAVERRPVLIGAVAVVGAVIGVLLVRRRRRRPHPDRS